MQNDLDEDQEAGAIPSFAPLRETPDDVLDPEKTTFHGHDLNPQSTTPPDEERESPSLPPSTKRNPLNRLKRGVDALSTGSSPASTRGQFSQETADAAASIATSVAVLATTAANKRSRSGSQTKWLLTEKESTDLGRALGNIVGRRVPEDAIGEDAVDMFVVASVALGYGLRQAFDVSPADQLRAEEMARHGEQSRPVPHPDEYEGQEQ